MTSPAGPVFKQDGFKQEVFKQEEEVPFNFNIQPFGYSTTFVAPTAIWT